MISTGKADLFFKIGSLSQGKSLLFLLVAGVNMGSKEKITVAESKGNFKCKQGTNHVNVGR